MVLNGDDPTAPEPGEQPGVSAVDGEPSAPGEGAAGEGVPTEATASGEEVPTEVVSTEGVGVSTEGVGVSGEATGAGEPAAATGEATAREAAAAAEGAAAAALAAAAAAEEAAAGTGEPAAVAGETTAREAATAAGEAAAMAMVAATAAEEAAAAPPTSENAAAAGSAAMAAMAAAAAAEKAAAAAERAAAAAGGSAPSGVPDDTATAGAKRAKTAIWRGPLLPLGGIIVVGIVVAAVVVSTAPGTKKHPKTTSTTSTTTRPVPMTTFSDPTYGFTISYPRTWQRLTAPNVPLIVKDGNTMNAFQVQVLKNPAPVTNSTTVAALKQLTGDILTLSDVSIQAERSFTLNGMRGYFYLVLFQDPKTKQKGANTIEFLFQGTKVSVLTFQALPQSNLTVALGHTFDTILNSFKSNGSVLGPAATVPTATTTTTTKAKAKATTTTTAKPRATTKTTAKKG